MVIVTILETFWQFFHISLELPRQSQSLLHNSSIFHWPFSDHSHLPWQLARQTEHVANHIQLPHFNNPDDCETTIDSPRTHSPSSHQLHRGAQMEITFQDQPHVVYVPDRTREMAYTISAVFLSHICVINDVRNGFMDINTLHLIELLVT